MKTNLFVLAPALLFFSTLVSGQNQIAPVQTIDPSIQPTRERISNDFSKVTKSLDLFNARLDDFLQSLNKYKGIQLSESQQRMLFAYEVLNQTEQLSATLRKSLVETADREATLRRRLQQIDFDLRRENLDKAVQMAGTTRLDEARENQRRKLEEERNTLQSALREIEYGRDQITENLRFTQSFADSFRRSLFSQIKSEMGN